MISSLYRRIVKRRRFKYVEQDDNEGCGIATFAMLSRLTYDEALDALDIKYGRDDLKIDCVSLADALTKIGIEAEYTPGRFHKNVPSIVSYCSNYNLISSGASAQKLWHALVWVPANLRHTGKSGTFVDSDPLFEVFEEGNKYFHERCKRSGLCTITAWGLKDTDVSDLVKSQKEHNK